MAAGAAVAPLAPGVVVDGDAGTGGRSRAGAVLLGAVSADALLLGAVPTDAVLLGAALTAGAPLPGVPVMGADGSRCGRACPPPGPGRGAGVGRGPSIDGFGLTVCP